MIENPDTVIHDLQDQIRQARELLEEIIITDGADQGVILKSWESPTNWDEKLKCSIYEYENFSELGDALIKLHRMLK